MTWLSDRLFPPSLSKHRWGELEGNERAATGHSQTWLAKWNHLESFGEKNLDAQFHWDWLIGISEGRSRRRDFESFPGLYRGSDIWQCVQSFSDFGVHPWSLVSVLQLEFWFCRLYETRYLLKSERKKKKKHWVLCGQKMRNKEGGVWVGLKGHLSSNAHV